jgi:hypothetical protein
MNILPDSIQHIGGVLDAKRKTHRLADDIDINSAFKWHTHK